MLYHIKNLQRKLHYRLEYDNVFQKLYTILFISCQTVDLEGFKTRTERKYFFQSNHTMFAFLAQNIMLYITRSLALTLHLQEKAACCFYLLIIFFLLLFARFLIFFPFLSMWSQFQIIIVFHYLTSNYTRYSVMY